MNIETNKINIGGLEVTLQKKDIKNIYLGVYPPNGTIRLDVPHMTNEEVIRLFTISKIPWIRKQQKRFSEQERETQREYISGESHFLFGKAYRLNLIENYKEQRVEIKNTTYINLHCPKKSTKGQRKKIFENWCRQELNNSVKKYVNKWEKITNIKVKESRIKKMKTKWGTSNKQAKRIWINLELVKKPTSCLEYIILHEMIHLIERKHNDNFNKLMNSFMPGWQQQKRELNKSLLGYAKWKY